MEFLSPAVALRPLTLTGNQAEIAFNAGFMRALSFTRAADPGEFTRMALSFFNDLVFPPTFRGGYLLIRDGLTASEKAALENPLAQDSEIKFPQALFTTEGNCPLEIVEGASALADGSIIDALELNKARLLEVTLNTPDKHLIFSIPKSEIDLCAQRFSPCLCPEDGEISRQRVLEFALNGFQHAARFLNPESGTVISQMDANGIEFPVPGAEKLFRLRDDRF